MFGQPKAAFSIEDYVLARRSRRPGGARHPSSTARASPAARASPTLFWLGDQLQSWDEYDGIKSAVVGLLSGGVSGFSLLHSDTGGYVTLKLSSTGGMIPVIARTPELLMRWMELNAFTAVFRTHEGLDPAISAQFDAGVATLAHPLRLATRLPRARPLRGLVADAAARATRWCGTRSCIVRRSELTGCATSSCSDRT